MKALFQCTITCLVFALLVACGGSSPEGEAAKTSDKTEEAATATATSTKYRVDIANSSVMWTGSKATGTHSGTIKVSAGELAIADGNLTAGNFELDMNSIDNTDMKAGDGKEKLEEHLKSPDFFDVATYPKATFVLSSSKKITDDPDATHELTGNLTMRDQTKSVTFKANVAALTDRVTAVTPPFTINRTEWGINYSSGVIGTIKDKLINDDIGLVVNLVAMPLEM